MVLSGSRRFSMFLSTSCLFLIGSQCSHRFSVVSVSQWFSQVLTSSRRFSLVLNVSQWFLLFLIGS